MSETGRFGAVIDWCGAYLVISCISLAIIAVPGRSHARVLVTLVLGLGVTLAVHLLVRRWMRWREVTPWETLFVSSLCVTVWLLLFVALDSTVHSCLRPDEGYWRGWWSWPGAQFLVVYPLPFVFTVWADLEYPRFQEGRRCSSDPA